MKCPKCAGQMFELKIEILHGKVSIDKCSVCAGIWFDTGEAEQLKEEWASDFIDTGDPKLGKHYNEIRAIDCPRCGEEMRENVDTTRTHLQFEVCEKHGVFMDAGEFNDYKLESAMDIFQDAVAAAKGKQESKSK